MKREIKIGIFMAAIFAVLAASVFFVGKVGRLFHKGGYVIQASFESVAGLDRQAVVRIGGVRVGFVEGIRLEGNRPLVSIKITRRDVFVPSDSKATLATLGMLGEKYIEIQPGLSKEPCSPGGRLEALTPAGLDQVGGLLLDVGGEIKEVGNSLRTLLNAENQENVEAALRSLASLTADLEAFLGESGTALRDGVREGSLAARDARQAVRDISAELKDSAEALRGMLDENRGLVKSSMEKIQELLREIEVSVKRLGDALDKINKGEGVAGRLIQDPDWRDRAEHILDGAAGAADAVGSLRAGVDVRAEYYGESRLAKGSLGFDLGLGPRSLVRAGLTRDPWEDRFAYSLQVGRRFGPFAPRAGLIESEFGVGLDYEAWGRRLRLSLDGFDFNRDDGPRFRASTRFFPARPLFVVLGLDDFSLASGREFYVGLGIEAR